jgi:hypothetical protein
VTPGTILLKSRIGGSTRNRTPICFESIAGLAVLVVLSLVLGLAHRFGNPRATTTVATDAPSTLLLEDALMPVEVSSVLRQKCGDCHSTQTRWPWYGRFAPVSWLMEKEITEAPEQMNPVAVGVSSG